MNYPAENISTLYLLRHGEIATPGILAGQTDVALSDNGWQQLNQALGVNLVNGKAVSMRSESNRMANVGLVISSPLQRCQAFAQQFCQQHNLPLVIEPRIKEMNFGEWDGKTYKALWSAPESSKLIGSFWQDPWQVTPPQGEPIDDFVARVDDWWQALLMQLKQEAECSLERENQAGLEKNSAIRNEPSKTLPSSGLKKSTLVISHAGVIKLLIARILKMPIPGTAHMTCVDIPYAGLIKVEVFHDAEKSWPKLIL